MSLACSHENAGRTLKIETDTKKVFDKYFFYYFDWETFQERIVDNTQGGAMQNLVGMNIFRETLIPVPSPSEQEAIAEALGDIDSLIDSLDRLITKKRNIKQGAMQELLTGEKSKSWKLISLEKSFSLNARIGWQGLTTAEYKTSGDFHLVTGTDFENGQIKWETCHFVDKWRFAQDRHIQIRTGDVLVTKDGTIGKVAYVNQLPHPSTLNSGVFILRPKADTYSSKFLFYILNSEYFDRFLKQLAASSTISHLYQRDFITFTYPAPSFEEQESIAEILMDMDSDIEIFENQRRKYSEIKQGMMQELLTGKKRLI